MYWSAARRSVACAVALNDGRHRHNDMTIPHHTVDLIRHKRDGGTLTPEEIEWLVREFTNDTVHDYQMAAFLMAVLWRGMEPGETVALTLAMLRSGEELRARDVLSPVVDKHSTGGVGDKVTLAVAPLG